MDQTRTSMAGNLIILAAAAVLAGCAGVTRIDYRDAQEVPALIYATPAPGTGKVTFVRDYYGGLNGSFGVYIDGELVARLRGKEKAVVYLPEGVYGFSSDALWNVESIVKAGTAVVYNVQLGIAIRSVER